MTSTLRRSPLSQLAVIGLALAGTVASFSATATPAYAATSGYYQVQLASPVTGTARDIQNDVAWKCEGETCRGTEGNSRAEVVCARLARKFGVVAAFAVKGEALDAEALAKCNGEKAAPLARR